MPRIAAIGVGEARNEPAKTEALPYFDYKRLGHETQSEVSEIPLPSTIVFSLPEVPPSAKAVLAIGSTPVDDPRACIKVEVTAIVGEHRHTLWNDLLRNPAAHEHVRPDEVDSAAAVRRSTDGVWSDGFAWSAPGDDATAVFRWTQKVPLTAIALVVSDHKSATGVPSRISLETSTDGSIFSAATVIERGEKNAQWHRLVGTAVKAIRLRILATHDGAPPVVEEVLFSKSKELGPLAQRLGDWKRLHLDLRDLSGQQADIELRIGPLVCQRQSCAGTGFVSSLRILPGRTDDRLNLVLISMDTVRADRTSLHGYERPTTPFLEELAGRPGVTVFTNSRSSSTWTPTSHLSMMTGLTPLHHRVNVNFTQVAGWRSGARDLRSLSPQLPTIASLLRENGYYTVAMATAGFLPGELGLQNGFDIYATPEQHLPDEALDYHDELESKALLTERWLQTHSDHPFFLFLHSYVAHHPYRDTTFAECDSTSFRSEICQQYHDALYPAANRMRHLQEKDLAAMELLHRDFLSDTYDGGLRLMDQYVRRVFEVLDHLDLTQSTIVVVTSDHGEAFGEHLKPFYGAHGYGFYDEYLRVPLLVARPSDAAPRTSDVPVSSVDILPTITDALGLWTPGGDGLSLWPVVEGGNPDNAILDRLIFYEGMLLESYEEHHFIAVSKGNFKLLANLYDIYDGNHRLHDLASDPGETRDISKQFPDLANAILDSLNQRIIGAFAGMLVLELKTTEPRSIEGVLSLDRPARLFEIAIRDEADFIRRDTDPGTYVFKLSLGKERRLIGFETDSDEFRVFFRGLDDNNGCTLVAGPEGTYVDFEFSLLHSHDLGTTLKQRLSAPDVAGDCVATIYHLEPTVRSMLSSSGNQWEDMSEDTRERTLEQMKALGYIE